MNHDDAPFEIHVHGDVKLRSDVGFDALQDALKPLWKYAGALSGRWRGQPVRGRTGHSLRPAGAPVADVLDAGRRRGLSPAARRHVHEPQRGQRHRRLGRGDLYDAEFDEEDEDAGRESRDDFLLLFVGPTPQAIMQAQRDLLVEDVVQLMSATSTVLSWAAW
jgi:hypothetical protein